jgi:hypothetical protein
MRVEELSWTKQSNNNEQDQDIRLLSTKQQTEIKQHDKQ